MKILIWSGCIIVCAFAMTILGVNNSPLLATLLFAGSCVLAKFLSGKWDTHKRREENDYIRQEKDKANITNSTSEEEKQNNL